MKSIVVETKCVNIKCIEVREMKKRFYEEPEMEMRVFDFTNVITGPSDGLDIEDTIPEEEGGGGSVPDPFPGGELY